MDQHRQLPLFNDVEASEGVEQQVSSKYYNGREIGTFKDGMRAPIHRWFRYPAGYSYRFVYESFDMFEVGPGAWVYDPFSGSGTTLICAKQKGISAYGVEAHSFVHWVASVKLYWEYDLKSLGKFILGFLVDVRNYVGREFEDATVDEVFPPLVYKCYHPQDLKVLYLLREYITQEVADVQVCDFLKLALTETLRSAAAAGTGWPYIAPRKNDGRKPPKNALKVFSDIVNQMYEDLRFVVRDMSVSEVHNVLGDSRNRQNLADGQVKLALTSPPYLNNYDYADRTRLETYFWGITHTWRDITQKYRDKLMVAATTQVTRSEYQVETALSEEIRQIDKGVYETLQRSILELADLRLQKGGKKDYDLMVALYFNDIVQVLIETHRVLERGGYFCLVLGDSAPYGVHVQTDQLIGQLGLGLGFSAFDYHNLRKRGGKWKANPQRHSVPLREGIIILNK